MSGENGDSFSRDRAELFEALGHPTRIKIIQVLSESPLGFADLKRRMGIESNGLISFHIGKLDGLVKTSLEGDYVLTDEGREALRIIAIKDSTGPRPERKRFRVRLIQIIAIIMILALATTTYLSYTALLEVSSSIPPPPISQTHALQIALDYGGWNPISLFGKTVTVTLNLYRFRTLDNQTAGIDALGQISGPVDNYSSWQVGDATYRYVWVIVITFPNPRILSPGFYFVDAATGEVIPTPPRF